MIGGYFRVGFLCECPFLQEDEDKEEELHSESEAGEEEEVDVTTVGKNTSLMQQVTIATVSQMYK